MANLKGLADSFELSTEEDFDVLGSLPGDRDVASRSAASGELNDMAESQEVFDAIGVDLGQSGLPQPSPLEEVSVVNFGTLRREDALVEGSAKDEEDDEDKGEDLAEDRDEDVRSEEEVGSPTALALKKSSSPAAASPAETSVYSAPSFEMRSSASALAAFAASVSRENKSGAPLPEEDSGNRRLIDELQRDNERLAALAAANDEARHRERQAWSEERAELEDAAKAAKTELVLRRSAKSPGGPADGDDVEAAEAAEAVEASARRLKKELALAAERDDLRAELATLAAAKRDDRRRLLADLEAARTALAKASEGRRAAELELEALRRKRGGLTTSRQGALLESAASPLKSPLPPSSSFSAAEKEGEVAPSPSQQRRRDSNATRLLEAADARCRELEVELATEREQHEARIDALRSEFGQLRLAHEKRLEELREPPPVVKKPDTAALNASRREANELRRTVAELESSLEAVRQFYASKLDAERTKHDAALKKAMQQSKNHKMRAALSASNDNNNGSIDDDAENPAVVVTKKKTLLEKPFEVKALEIEIERLTEINRRLEEDKAAEMQRSHALRLDDEEGQKRRAEAEDALKSMKVQAADLETALTEAKDALLNAEEARADAEKQASRDLERLREKLAAARADARAAADDADDARRRADVAETPHQVAVAALAKQVDDLEAKNRDRQRDVDRAVHEAKAAARIELARVQARHNEHLAAKDAQLQRFRFELDKLLDALRVELSHRHHYSSKNYHHSTSSSEFHPTSDRPASSPRE
mmetsp:Transcript_27425/g.88565  ORF Transcript_27425/g.88565 Transcript_27425/m.88565 type:complete len:772 (+) Transcript_27425:62-2377(+)